MNLKTNVRILAMAVLLAGGIVRAETGACAQTLTTDAKAVTVDIQAIAAQANAQGFRDAVEQFAADIEEMLPTLSRPSQDAVEKFVTDLSKATSESSPGGTSISPSERLVLINDWVILVTSTGATQQQLDTITADLTAAFSALQGIDTTQLQTDLQVLLNDARACAGNR